MLKKRIIPCLDIQNGRTVKGVNFTSLKDAGDPVELATRYVQEGADELVFLDITATHEKRKTVTEWVSKVANVIHIPFTVGGGIRSVMDAEAIIESGADKISINSSAVQNPKLISDIASRFGSQCVVVAVDTKLENGLWKVVTHGGRQNTGMLTTDWVREIEARGGGEILLTSMEHDGTKSGFALSITQEVTSLVRIPVIASGGAGTMIHFYDVFTATQATGALAASIFHYKEIEIPELKSFLLKKNIPVRILTP
jgi:cyclase